MVKPGDRLFLNDGLVQMVVKEIDGHDVHCRVAVGGELRSRKGLNLPGSISGSAPLPKTIAPVLSSRSRRAWMQ